MENFIVDPFYENIRAPMWVNFSSPDEVEGDSWFDTLSDTDDAERVRLMPTEFEIAQLLPDQVFDASTPEKPRSPTTMRIAPPATPAPVFSDEEGDDEDSSEDVRDSLDDGPDEEDALMADADEETVSSPESYEDTEAQVRTPIFKRNSTVTCDENAENSQVIESAIGLPPSPQMPKESAEPMTDDAPAPEEDGKANELVPTEETSATVEEESPESNENDTDMVDVSTAEILREQTDLSESETPISEEPMTNDMDIDVDEMESASTEGESCEPNNTTTEEPSVLVFPEEDNIADACRIEEEAEAPTVNDECAESVEGQCDPTPQEDLKQEDSTVKPPAASHESTCTPARDALVKPVDIFTPPTENVEMEEASVSADSGLNISAVVTGDDDYDDFLVEDDDIMAEINNKEAAMMEEIAEKRRALELKKAAAEMMEVRVMNNAQPHAGLRTPTLQEAFAKHRKKTKKSNRMTITAPQEFSFSTQARAEMREPIRRKSYSSASDSEATMSRAWTGHITEPKEFHFKTEERVQLRQSMRRSEAADALMQQSTPSRTREWTGELTEPQEFHFSTDERSQLRSMNKAPIVSSDEKDLQECRDFKAYPLNRKVLESAGDLGVPRLPKRKLTRPQSPALATRERSVLKKRLRGEVDDEAGSGFDSGTDCQVDFAARFGRESDQANKLRRLSLTQPQPFSFHTEQRAALRQSIRPSRPSDPVTPRTCYSSDCESSMANSAQRRASAKRSRKRKRAVEQAQPLKLTEPKPFSFATDERALLRTPSKKRKLAEASEDSYADVEVAKKLYSTFDRFAPEPYSCREDDSVHKKARRRSRSMEPRKLTEPQPFRFQTEQRAQQAAVTKPRDASSTEAVGSLFAPLSKVKRTSKRSRAPSQQPAAPRVLSTLSATTLNAAPARSSARLAKSSKKGNASSLMKPTASSTASSTAASKAIVKKTRTHTMKTRASRRKLTEPHSPLLQTRLRAAAIHGMRDL